MFEEFFITITLEKIFLGILLATFLETIFPPIPSEVVLPVAGYVISLKDLDVFGLLYGVFFATIGATAGALIYYYIALTLGRKFIKKYGKYFSIDRKKMEAAEKWFEKYGKSAVFFGRMIPGIRELISIPAGLLRMNLVEYLFYTFLGSFAWSFFLITLGYFFGEAPVPQIKQISNLIVLAIVLSVVSYLIFRRMVKRGKK
ncbi:MAG: DedA family protein [Candidatus Aenigmarchaeota archaeon]|nr:DedA family protein [Candidatus Aenigmarchaeota archaeon]MCX8191052.1 DedA family protein [Candidatus Aenigmarchaeota archaeon]MDW8160292.1 DedA family protein [Candidatus Aenigmarchaeota archaeon]